MPVFDHIMPRLFALAKRNFLVKKLARPFYLFLAKMRIEFSFIGKRRTILPQISFVITSAKEWALKKSDTENSPEYISIDQELIITRKLPDTLGESIHWKYLQNLEAHLPETFLLKIPNGRALLQGFVVNAENELIGDVSKLISRSSFVDQFEDHPALHTKLPPLEARKGKVVVLSVSFAGTNYYHWMLDLLPRLALIKRGGESMDAIDFFLVNDHASRFQRESLEQLGIPRKKILEGHWHPHIQATELIVPSFPSDTGHFAQWQIEWLREKFEVQTHERPYRRLYLNRRKVSYRKVENESDIEQFLEQYGFESIDPGDYSVQEQVRIFSESECLIAPHGAALTNIAFCQAGTKILELLHPRAINLMYWNLSETIGLHYSYLLGEDAQADDGIDHYDNFVDMRFSIESLSRMLEKLNISRK